MATRLNRSLGSFAGNAGLRILSNRGFSTLLGLTLFAICSLGIASATDVTTQHNDVSRTGQNTHETILTPVNVNMAGFGKVFTMAVDGTIDAEPLYLSAIAIPSQGTHNVLYTVTENDTVYAFDADTGAPLWHVSVLGANETPSDAHGCGQITPQIGITSTPVIDRTSGPHGTIYVVAMSKNSSSTYFQRIHALDITTGAEEFGGPTTIQATYPGSGDNSKNGVVTFDPGQYADRAGLLLLNHVIYTAWTSHCDARPYTGWIMGFSESTLAQTSVLNVTPNGNEGAIWQAGAGLASSGTNIFLLDANGTFDTTLTSKGLPVNGDYGNGFLRVTTTGKLRVTDYFEMSNTVTESNNDQDLGSGGVIILPAMKDSTGKSRALAIGAGKDSNIYLVDRTNLGKYNPNGNTIYQEVDGALPGGVWSMGAYFNNSVYFGPVGSNLLQFTFSQAKLGLTSASKSSTAFGYPGSTPSVSASGTKNGIVWAIDHGGNILHAYSATNLGNELYNSNQATGSRDHLGTASHFGTPMIVNGRVYVGTTTGVVAYGLLPK